MPQIQLARRCAEKHGVSNNDTANMITGETNSPWGTLNSSSGLDATDEEPFYLVDPLDETQAFVAISQESQVHYRYE